MSASMTLGARRLAVRRALSTMACRVGRCHVAALVSVTAAAGLSYAETWAFVAHWRERARVELDNGRP